VWGGNGIGRCQGLVLPCTAPAQTHTPSKMCSTARLAASTTKWLNQLAS
jgi:hypothetical protein